MISVIIPVYNCEKYIAHCIESILQQTYQDFEILVVNDGSVDRSGEILKKYAEQDSRIRYYQQKNQGVSAARNWGIDHAQGEYVLFVDGDDFLEKNVLEVLIKEMIDYDLDCVSYNSRLIYPDGKKEITIPGSGNIYYKLNSPREHAEFLEKQGRLFFYSSCRHLFKKEILFKYHIRFFKDVRLAEDTSFCHIYMLFVQKGKLLTDFVGYNYLQHNLSATHVNVEPWKDCLEEYLKRINALYNFLCEYHYMTYGKYELSNLSWEFLLRYAQTAKYCYDYEKDCRIKKSSVMRKIVLSSIWKYGYWKRKILILIWLGSLNIFCKILKI